MMKKLVAIGALAGLSACTPGQIGVWLNWYEADPDAAVEFANEPWVQQSLASGSDPNYNEPNEEDQEDLDMGQGDDDLGNGGVTPGDCDSYADEAAAAGLPWSTFRSIAWRESGCNHTVRVDDHNDTGGGILGFNFQGDGGYWSKCGLTWQNLTDSVSRQMECAAMAYDELGLQPWQ